MFVGLSIDSLAASSIRKWAELAYEGQPVRLVEASQMHSTLAFFPSVTDERRQWMAELVRTVEWDPLDALTGETVLLGKGALALKLVFPREVAARLSDRLIRTNYLLSDDKPDWETVFEYHERLLSEPLGQLISPQGEAQGEQYRRARHNGRNVSLHVTFARYRRKDIEAIPRMSTTPIAVRLPRVALFESHLGTEASAYEIIAASP